MDGGTPKVTSALTQDMLTFFSGQNTLVIAGALQILALLMPL
jgi:hypothetical protein